MKVPARILIVDDEEVIRFSLEAVLSQDGYDVTVVDSGEAALDLIQEHVFDLVLLDLKMKGIGGLETLAALRRQPSDAAVIVLTAHGSMETAIEALRQGAHDYLLKPCETRDLRESVMTALLKRQREQRRENLLRQVEQSLVASLEEIRAAVVKSPVAVGTDARREGPRGGLVVDAARHGILLEGHVLDLSPTEFELLSYLAQKAPAVVSADELYRQILGYSGDSFQAAELVRHYVYRIRQKARCCAGRPDIIRTVRGVGYTLGDGDTL